MVLRRAFMRLLYSRQRLKIVLLFFVFSAFGYLCMVGMGPFGLIQSSLSNERENQVRENQIFFILLNSD